MAAYNKIGFLAANIGKGWAQYGSERFGLADYARQLDAAGIPVILACNDGTNGIGDVLELIKQGSTVPHVLGYRIVAYDDQPVEYYSVPDYTLEPSVAAQNHFNLLKPVIEKKKDLPRNRDHLWWFPVNEVRAKRAAVANGKKEPQWGDMHAWDWMGEFCYSFALLANAEGYKVAMPQANSGEPHVKALGDELDAWKQPGMAKFLRLCAERPNRVCIGLHEYSWDVENIMDGGGGKVGRVEYLFRACDEMGIARPNVIIGEWGWKHDHIPEPDVALKHIHQVAELYARHPQILGAFIWYLGPYNGSHKINEQTAKLLKPLTEATLAWRFPDPLPNGVLTIPPPSSTPPVPQPDPAPKPVVGVTVKNASFEADWGEAQSHKALRIDAKGLAEIEVGNIFTPPGWLTYFYHSADLAQPEVRDAWQEERTGGGRKGQLLFTFSRRHHGGFMQTVETEVGQQLSLTALAHAWSNHKDDSKPDRFPHPDDPKWSEGVGYGGRFILEGETADDAERNFTFRVGIDPTGGRDPRASSVVWGRGAHIYNKFYTTPAAEAVAQGERATIFLESRTLWAFKHNDAYWDSVVMLATTDPEPPTIPPDVPKRPLPTKVKHTVHLLPQRYTEAEFMAVCQHLYPTRTGITFSHDVADAVTYAGTDESKVIGWDVGRWDFDVEGYFAARDVVFERREVAELAPKPPIEPEPTDPLHGLVLGRILSKPYVMTSPFDAPRTYNGKKEKHEGVDFDVTEAVADSKASVLAVLSGVVTAVYRRAGGYGLRVIVKSQHNGIELVSWYGHLDQAYVEPGRRVKLGEPLGEVGTSGWVTGEHVHYTLQAIGHGHGRDGYVLPDIVDPTGYFDHGATVPPPASQGYDMAKYFLPPNGRVYGDIFMLKNNWSGGSERVQVQQHNGHSFIVKNQSYEQRSIDNSHIRLLLDTSPGDGQYYTVKGVWMPRRWQVGQSFTRTEFVEWFWKDSCQPVAGKPSQNYNSKLKFVQHWREWTAPKSGIVLKDVVKLHWEINGRVDEEYWFAAGMSLIRWRKYDGRESWIHELIPAGSQGNNERERLRCL